MLLANENPGPQTSENRVKWRIYGAQKSVR